MSVKLYNLSNLPDEPLRSIITAAKLCAGAQGDVVVKVTRGGRRTRSYAQSCRSVYRWALSRRSTTKTNEYRQRAVLTDGGWIVLQPLWCYRYNTVPDGLLSCTAIDGLATAQRLFETAIHEFAHIIQFQTRSVRFATRGESGRRPAWGKRPEEIDAINRTDDALSRLKRRPERKREIDNWIIDLGIQIEGLSQRRHL